MTSELDRLMQRVALGVAVLTLAGMGYGELSYGGPTGDVPDAGELTGWPVLTPWQSVAGGLVIGLPATHAFACSASSAGVEPPRWV